MNLIGNHNLIDGHLHAWCLFKPTYWKHFVYLFISILACKLTGAKSVTTHLPLELQHHIYPNIKNGKRLVKFGRFLAALLKVKLYWENAPLLNYAIWNLKQGQIEWELVPNDIPLCLDTGHEMLGSISLQKAQDRILFISRNLGHQIKHLHIHENDLVHDLHNIPDKIITQEILREIIKSRTFIFEK